VVCTIPNFAPGASVDFRVALRADPGRPAPGFESDSINAEERPSFSFRRVAESNEVPVFLALTLAALLPPSHDVRDVVAIIRQRCVALSFIEAAQPVKVVIDENAPTDRLLAEVTRQSSQYELAMIDGRQVLMPREPRYRRRVDGVKISGRRAEVVNEFVLLLRRRREFSTFLPWGILGAWLGGRPSHVPLEDDVVTDDRPGSVVEHFVRLLGSDKLVYFNAEYGTWGDAERERRIGIYYARLVCKE